MTVDNFPHFAKIANLLFMLCFLPFFQPGPALAIVTEEAKIPVIRIDARGLTALEIGLAAGQQSKARFPDIKRRYDAHLAALFSSFTFDQMVREHLPILWQRLDPVYQEELKGIASAWSLVNNSTPGDGLLSLDEYRVLNLLADLGFPPDGSGFSVFDKISAENGPIVGRNLDWNTTPELRSLQAITVYQRERHSMVNVGFAGIISVLNGFNDQGLFLALFNAAPYSPYQRDIQLKGARSSVFNLRKALENYSSASAAGRFLKSSTYDFSGNILMADQKAVQVLEYPAADNALLRTWNSALQTSLYTDKIAKSRQQIVVVDCHLLADLHKYNNCKDASDIVRWQRLLQLADFSPTQPAHFNDVSALLFDTANRRYEIFNARTLQSLLYLPASNSLYLYTAPVQQTKSTAPAHLFYPDLFARGIQNNRKNENGISYIWPVSLLLLLMAGTVFWIIKPSGKKARAFSAALKRLLKSTDAEPSGKA